MITLKDIIEEYMVIVSDSEHILYGVSKNLVVRAAKRGLEDLHYAVVPDIISIVETLEAPFSLSLPEGTIDWIRVSAVGDNGKRLIPLYQNKKHPLAVEYLQDELGANLLDENGFVLMGMEGVPTNENDSNLAYLSEVCSFGYNYNPTARFNIAGGNISTAGSYKYDPVSKMFYFYNIPSGTKLVFEVIQLPTFDETEANVGVHEYLRETMFSYITYHIAKGRFSIPEYSKNRLHKDYIHEKRRSKKRMHFKPEQIMQALRTQRGLLNKF